MNLGVCRHMQNQVNAIANEKIWQFKNFFNKLSKFPLISKFDSVVKKLFSKEIIFIYDLKLGSDHVIYSSPGWGEIREKFQIPLCRHRLRWNFGPIK